MAAAEDVSYGLGLAGVDPAGLGRALAEAGAGIARRPDRLAQAGLGLALEEIRVALDVARRLLGADGEPAVRPEPGDRRFGDPAWTGNPFLLGVLESYLVSARWARRLVDSADLDPISKRKAGFAVGLLFDALSPSNVPWLNPAVVKRAIDTGGLSVARGFANWLEDLVENRGRPRQVDRSGFELGSNLAATPGRVVFRNDLIELIAFEPQTETVFARPLLYSPAWINKYYVLDLAPGRSFIEFAVARGFTVFAISYRNPDASMAALMLDDYLRDGLFAALDRVSELTGSDVVDLIGVCIGGTLATIGLGVLAARGEADRVGSATLLNTLVDFADPGEIGIFTDEATIERIERRNTGRAYADSVEISDTFDLLRAADLVWAYVVANWYMGEQPPAFDILAWNADATRLPAAMHSQFLRACYLENRLAGGTFEIDGTLADPARIETPLYVLTSEKDHIAPWRSAYRTTQLVGGEVRHVLASGGHIAGMVTPPTSTKAFHYASQQLSAEPEAWLHAAARVDGSWWNDWVAWAAPRAGERVPPPSLPDGEPAPGRYARE
jgi:polyhydroxyalkanoate synthase subunit PhaC